VRRKSMDWKVLEDVLSRWLVGGYAAKIASKL